MDLEQIRKRLAYDASAKISVKHALQAWLCGLRRDYQLAVTLTLKQTLEIRNDRGVHYRRLTRDDCDRIAKRLTQKLNRQVFGHSAERYGHSLRYLAVVEGTESGKNLHLHMAIGNLPEHVRFNEFPQLVKNSICLVRELDTQYDVKLMDSGWLDYITKELSTNSTDNVLWQLA